MNSLSLDDLRLPSRNGIRHVRVWSWARCYIRYFQNRRNASQIRTILM